MKDLQNLENMKYDDIAALSEEEASSIALEVMDIKGYTVYFIDFKGYYGYSYLAYKNKHQITEDFALHHGPTLKEKGTEGLKKYYINTINHKLFTEEELQAPLKSYEEYDARSYFLTNYYHKERDYVSMFCIISTEQQQREYDAKIEGKIANKIGFCYMDPCEAEFIKHHYELAKKLRTLKASVADNYEYQKSAFLYEMFNHEYAINLQADYDVISVFSYITYREDDDLNKYFDDAKFTDTQKRAYLAARKEYFKKQDIA